MQCMVCNKQLNLYQIRKKNKFCSQECDVARRKKFLKNNFDELTCESAYWAGFLYGDGYINKKNTETRICLSTKDLNHLIKFSFFIFDKDCTLVYGNKAILQISDKKLCENLNRFGIINRKTYESIPILPKQFEKDFIRGYFDADGWYSKGFYENKNNGKKYEKITLGICAYSEEPLIIVNSVLPIKGYINKKKKQHLYELRWSSKNEIQIIKNFIDGEIKLERKWKQ